MAGLAAIMMPSGDGPIPPDSMAASTMAFGASFVALKWLMERNKSWGYSGGNLPALAASRAMSLVHSAAVTLLASRGIVGRGIMGVLSERLASNTAYQESVLRLSMGYFVVDTLGLLIWDRDPLFLMHHILAALSFASHLYTGRGGLMVFLAIFYGEMSAPFLSMSWLCRKRGLQVWSERLFCAFRTVFLANRCLVLPMYSLPLAWQLLGASEPEHGVPAWLLRTWGGMMLFGLAGGLVWSQKLVKSMMRRQRATSPPIVAGKP